MSEELIKKLSYIQRKLKAPKSQFNQFGKYNYRNCEDILEAIKPLLPPELSLIIHDEIIMVGQRIYVKSTAQLGDGKDWIVGTAYARESESKKGMDDSQVTGAASSYARKYALNGLFLIDDTKDADSEEGEKKPVEEKKPKPFPEKPKTFIVRTPILSTREWPPKKEGDNPSFQIKGELDGNEQSFTTWDRKIFDIAKEETGTGLLLILEYKTKQAGDRIYYNIVSLEREEPGQDDNAQ